MPGIINWNDLEPHDVVIASHSLGMFDIKEALKVEEKINYSRVMTSKKSTRSKSGSNVAILFMP